MDKGAEDERSIGRAAEWVDGMFGMGHQSHDVAVGVRDPGDSGDRAVRALALVAEDDPVRGLELREQLGAGEEASLAVLHGDPEALAFAAPRRERRVGALDTDRHVAADKTE